MRKVMPPPQPEVRMRSGDHEGGNLVEAADDLLHPEIAEHQGLEVEGRAQEGDEALTVDVDGERLLADDLALDLVQAPTPDLEVRAHGPYRAMPA